MRHIKPPFSISMFPRREMAEGVGSSWLPSGFVSDDLFFMESERKHEETSGAPVDESLFSSSHRNHIAYSSPADCSAAEGADKDHLARLTLHMAQSFLLDDEDEGDAEEQSLVSSPALYMVEPKQQLQKGNNWPVLSDAKGRRLRVNTTEPYKDHYSCGLLEHRWKAFPPLPAPYGYMRIGAVPPAVQQLRAAQFHRMKQQLHLMKQQHSRTRGVGDGGVPLVLSPSARCPLQMEHRQQRPKIGSWHEPRALLLNSSAGTGVFIPRTTGNKAEPPPPRMKRAAAALAVRNSELSDQRQRHNLLPHLPSMKSHELQLPQEWTY